MSRAVSARARLLSALQRLALERPGAPITLTALAREAGVSRPTVTRHLGGRAEVSRLLEALSPTGAALPHGTRERLVALALSHWGTSGAGAPSLERLALMAELAKASVYWHFPTKAQLLVAVAQLLAQSLDGRLVWEDAGAPSALRAGVTRLIQARHTFAQRYPASAPAMTWLMALGPEPAQRILAKAHQELRQELGRWLGALARRGQLTPGVDVEAVLGWLLPLLRVGESPPAGLALPARLAEVLVTGLQPGGR